MSEIEYPTLENRRIGDTPLLNCPHVRINDDVRMWYVPRGEGNGFDFFVGLFYTCEAEDAWRENVASLMGHPETQVECVFSGVAYFDGVRHLYMGDDTEHEGGYINYPDLRGLTCALAALTALEHKLCWYVREEANEIRG